MDKRYLPKASNKQQVILEHLRVRCWTKYSKRCEFLLNLSPPRRRRGCSDISYTSKILIVFMNFTDAVYLQYAALSLDFCAFSRPIAS